MVGSATERAAGAAVERRASSVTYEGIDPPHCHRHDEVHPDERKLP